MKARPTESQPASVPPGARQAGEVRSRWGWVESCVWTDRMLAALEDFLGYHFERGHRWPRKKSMHKLRDAIRAKTRRTNGHSLKNIIRSVNLTTRGWFGYFKHSHRSTFKTVDGWVRMRLRSILRRRAGRRGRGRGRDHQRWPNAFFATGGLFSLTAAHAAACRPPPG